MVLGGGFSRREALIGLGAFASAACLPAAADVVMEIESMQPGEFTWHPERSPHGGVAVIVSLPEQRVHVYRNGIRIAVSTCSTGKQGHETPTGVFTILQKDKHHHSSTYNNASMPNMNRLTWDGIALHAGNLPGYPASHGCVRLPMAFSEKLFGITHLGTPVIIAGAHNDPWILKHPGMLLDGSSEAEMKSTVATLEAAKHPKDWTEAENHPISTFLASTSDRRLYLFQNGEERASTKIDVIGPGPVGEHVMMLENLDGGLAWVGVTHHPDPTAPNRPEEDIISRLRIDPEFNRQTAAMLHPGMTLIITDLPSHADSRSGQDFVIMTS
ncbi:L,D-transpeptidase [Paracoccus sp. Z330]|uniref:L,D-transpeptidase n=1 Tax=Paracoccus onchidii TaxID=3017813 RepID=A0ABT4ZK59_9RHOB|nr:L,D-transpeptidase [Paracoccus onchidii]MDB6179703.1 L,D-transpeptidase [Paracoccus onchidii]